MLLCSFDSSFCVCVCVCVCVLRVEWGLLFFSFLNRSESMGSSRCVCVCECVSVCNFLLTIVCSCFFFWYFLSIRASFSRPFHHISVCVCVCVCVEHELELASELERELIDWSRLVRG